MPYDDQPADPFEEQSPLLRAAKVAPALEVDRHAIAKFIRIVARHLDCGTYFNLRGFDDRWNGRAKFFKSPAIGDGGHLDHVIEVAIEAALECAADGYNFCPPVATFYTNDNAKFDNLACCPVIVADIDRGHITSGWHLLTKLLGPATIVVASGGVCTKTGQEKLHIYWLLRTPTRTPEEHAQLKRVRAMVAHLAGGDGAAASLVQCFRWAGALHQKTSRRRSRFIELNEEVEVDLDEAEATLREAIEAIDGPGYFAPQNNAFTAGPTEVPLEWVQVAVPFIPNDDNSEWDKWVAMGMAMFAATGGSDEGFEVFVSWSKKRQDIYDYNECSDRWDHWKRSPPSKTGFGKLAKLARENGWRGPNTLAGITVTMPPDVAASTTTTPLLLNADGVPISNLAKPSIVPSLVRPSSLRDLPIPEMKWTVDDWIPRRKTTLLYADGGTGKTLGTQMLQASTAVGAPWFGLPIHQCRSLGIYCEDDDDELHRRLNAIQRHLGTDLNDARMDNMSWLSRVGEDNLLATFSRDGVMERTRFYNNVLEAALDTGARLLILDTAADLYGGDENNRNQVRQFVGALTRIAMRIDGAVILNAHPSRSGMSSGTMDGGSTGWSNSVRSRLSLERAKAADDAPVDTDMRILTKRKANYSSIGDTVKIRWQNGVLVPAWTTVTGVSAAGADDDVDTVFMALLAQTWGEGRPVSATPNAGNYAPKAFASNASRSGFGKREFGQAMERLFAAQRITTEEYGRPSSKGRPRRIVATRGAGDA